MTKKKIALLTILLLALVVRFFYIEHQSFWNDEGNSVRLTERSISLIIAGSAADIHPPLYYLLLKGWRTFLGTTEFAFRSFSAFSGLLLVATTYRLAKAYFPKKEASSLIAALLTALSPPLIYYSQEVRMYELLPLLSTLSTLLLYTLLKKKEPSYLLKLFYIVTLIASLYTHYFSGALLITHNLIFGFFWITTAKEEKKQVLLSWVTLMSITTVAFLPWLPIFLRQTGGWAGTPLPPLTFLTEISRWLFFFKSTPPTYFFLLITILIIISSFYHLQSKDQMRLLLPIHIFLPITLLLMTNAAAEPFFKFLLLIIPFLSIWLAGAISTSWTKIPTMLLLITLIFSQKDALADIYFNPDTFRADYRSIATRIAQEDRSDAAIILNAPNQWEVFTYYHPTGAPVFPIPKTDPTIYEIDQQLSTIAANHKHIYALFWGDAQRDPEKLVEQWLEKNSFKLSEEWVGDIRFAIYSIPQPFSSPPVETDLQFTNGISLLNYQLHPTEPQPGTLLQIQLFWQTAEPQTKQSKLFLHLIDENGQLITQKDSTPGGNLLPPTSWSPFEPVQDNHALFLPYDLPNGRYQLILGLYPIDDPTNRLPLLNSEESSWTLLDWEIR